MKELRIKKFARQRRANRVSKTTKGTLERPRLSVSISNKHITAQIIDDINHKTIVYATTVGQKTKGTMTEKAVVVGKEIATKAKKAKVSQVVFSRGPKLYHGRIKALADSARESGLEF